LIWHENEGAVQPKVGAANMLIQERFLKVCGVENGMIFDDPKVIEIMLHSKHFESRKMSVR
jgi:hypothetical protein